MPDYRNDPAAIPALVQNGQVHRDVYTDPGLFDLEMERLFAAAWVYVGHASQIPAPGDFITTTLGTTPVVMVRQAQGAIGVLINRCPHQGAALCSGEIVSRLESALPGDYRLTRQGEMLRCPWHCWEFDLRTGQSWCDPQSMQARTYAVSVEPGETLAKGPLVAETVPVVGVVWACCCGAGAADVLLPAGGGDVVLPPCPCTN